MSFSDEAIPSDSLCGAGKQMVDALGIVADPSVMMGKPVIAGTRITVESILERLAAGETVEQILDSTPGLTGRAIRSALTFAARALRADVVYPSPGSGLSRG